MTINEIISALRRCIFSDTLLQLAADTIEKLESENNRLKANYEALKAQEEKSHQYCKNICEPKYKAEIERLEEVIVKGDFTSYTAFRASESWHRRNSEHIKRLEEEIEMLMSPALTIGNVNLSEDKIAKLISSSPGQIVPCNEKYIKAEVVKEFEERLNDYVFEAEANDDPQLKVRLLFADDIEKSKKEMVGEF